MTNPDPFKRAEDEYFRLKGQLATGRITRAQFDAALKALMLQDAQGRYWMLGADDGKWYVQQGAQWIQANPSGAPSAPPTHLPERGTPALSTPAARKANPLPFILIGALVIVGLGIGAILFLNNQNRAPNVALQATDSAPLNSTVTPAPLASSPTSAPSATTIPSATSTPALAVSNVPNVQVTVVAAALPIPITAKDFAAHNAALAEKIAILNQAELKFIRDMRATSFNVRVAGFAFPSAQNGSALTEQDLKDLAGKAMDVAILADELGDLTAKQDHGSAQAAQSAEQYYNIARKAYSLVIESQNLRNDLVNNLIPGAQGIELIAEYGAQLWNSEITEGGNQGNPFSALLKNTEPSQTLNATTAAPVQAALNAAVGSIWIAQAETQTTRTLNVPAAQAPIANPFDPKTLQALTTAEGQTDGNKAQQVAAANLGRLGASASSPDFSKPTQLQVSTNSVAVAEAGEIKSGELPTFPSGTAVIVGQNGSGEGDPFLQSFGLNGEQPPTAQGKTDVKDAPALVNLTLSNIVIDTVNQKPKGSGSFEADTSFTFTVNWTTNLGAPQFDLSCVSGNNQTITQSSGSLTLKGNSLMILYPGTVDVYCYASTASGTQLGSTNVIVLVGDAAGATARAIQVETDSENLNRTLTADARGTESAQQTQEAATAQSIATMNALETEVGGTQTAEFKLTAAAFETKRAQPPTATEIPTATPTFTPQVVDQLAHPGNIFAVSTNVVLERGHLYRFTFTGQVNLINPTRSVSASDLPEHVNGITVPASGIVVVEGTGSVATITCGSGEPDPNDPGAFGITVEDLGPM